MEELDEKIKQLDESYSKVNQQLTQLQQEIEQGNKTVSNLENQYQEAQKNQVAAKSSYEELKSKEVINEHGIMTESEVILQIQKGEGFKTKDTFGKGDPYILAELEKNTQKTEVAKDLQFNVQWTFKVQNPESKLAIKAMDSNYTADDITGMAILDLQKYRDQIKHEEVLELTDKGKESGKVYISIIFNWSHADKLREPYEKAKAQSSQLEGSLKKAKQDLNVKKDSYVNLQKEKDENRRQLAEVSYKKELLKKQKEQSEQENNKQQSKKVEKGKEENKNNEQEMKIQNIQVEDKQQVSSQKQNKRQANEPATQTCGGCKNCNIF